MDFCEWHHQNFKALRDMPVYEQLIAAWTAGRQSNRDTRLVKELINLIETYKRVTDPPPPPEEP
jgi:hypothetical protein